MGSEGMADQRRHTAVTSQNGCMKTWSKSRGKHGIALDGEDWYLRCAARAADHDS